MKFTVEDITKHPLAKVEPKDIYATLWRCRDFELSHLWQRSIFLTAFLLLVYTGYGFCVLHQIEMPINVSNDIYMSVMICSLFVLYMGMVLSQLWIMMAKGSKAWYERYEIAITIIESDETFAQIIVPETIKKRMIMYGNLPLPSECDRNLFNTHPGAFSPSRINIFIGQFSWIVLFLAYIFHTILSILSGRLIILGQKPCCIMFYSVLIVIILNLISYILIRKMVSSKVLLGK